MKYVVEIAGERIVVELDAGVVRVEGETMRANVADVEGTPVRLVTIGDGMHRVVAHRTGARGQYSLSIDGRRFQVEALDERARAIRDLSAASAGASGPAPLVAPMPGLIVRVAVEEGDEVRAGEPLVVMEAMKMENELRSPAAGKVRSVLARVGAAVEKGALLVELE